MITDWPDEQDLSAATSGTAGGAQQQQAQGAQQGASAHLWEESWDDDDATGAGEDFAAALKAQAGK